MSKKKSKRMKKNRNVKSRAEKKATVLGNERKSRIPLIIACVCMVLITGSVLAFYSLSKKGTVAGTEPSTMMTDTSVVYPASLFDDGKARHFIYKYQDITIRYFILKSSDGIIRAAFDACDVCWRAGKGYYQQGDYMVCRNCGRRFASVLVNEVKGGCNPAPLNRGMSKEKLVIQVKDIIAGQQYFDFSRKI
ncbi:MAG: DUF2318 domain-containing protein [Desulfobacterales bacterium]|nr:MAG: DUF2318 domain-containing protein [Desulfobacterales bacterium]